MPALSPTMTEGTITAWKKKEGEAVVAGDVLLEIETDKAGMDVEAQEDGILAKILASEISFPNGSKVVVNEVIALLAEEGDDLSKVEVPKTAKAAAPAKEEKSEAPQKKADAGHVPQTAATPSSKLLSPAVAHLLLQHHITDVTKIPSTGPKGRGDVLAFLGLIQARPAPEPTIPQPKTLPPAAQPATQASPAAAAPAPGAAFTDSAASNMRKVIASRLNESKTTIPHSYVTRDIVVDNLMKLRRLLADELDVKVSVNDFLIKAASLALRDIPESNVRFSSDDHVKQLKDIDISVAVATPTGLITPIVKGAEARGVQSISQVVKDLAERAKKNKLKPEEYQGGSFSISNMGMFGVSHFTAIINLPQSSILAVGGARTVFKPSAVEEADMLTDSEVFEYLGGQSKKGGVTATKGTKASNADLDLIDFLGSGKPAKKTSTSSASTPLGEEVLRRLRPSLEKSQVVSVTLSIDERVLDSEVAGKFLGRLSHYVENPESMIL
ncbi:pyruvate dehydrogenase complex dihydrolipoamide acetyltransferase component (E2) [Lunasporangiospora selenospora]|uniref:Dihydrolipoamide acetyltransferase component of pyruvate dehydrogenase complex n=1 Tax=Lunasporangiospora selenospora TaxID=979761 RepID=A0A9P6KB43_9FUNG|nr:pyruvate dehydrogenase complex dihydrolipoamide acetyltransferase component (E2) [Lunasporangiospora selenospora]